MIGRRTRIDIPLPRLTIRDLAGEALAGVLQRPGRTVLTMVGTVIGVGTFVAVLGLTATAAGQISKRFNALAATEVVVKAANQNDSDYQQDPFPADADRKAAKLAGVREAGVCWPLPDNLGHVSTTQDETARASGPSLPVLAASPGFVLASRPTAWNGRLFDIGHDNRNDRVVVLGAGAARRLGINHLSGSPAVFINAIPFAVIGILTGVERNSELLSAVLLPRHTATTLWGQPEDVSTVIMRVDTYLGAAQTVARQLAVALRPDSPRLFTVVPPPDPRSLQSAVASDFQSLFLLLAGICLVIGAVGIANTTLVGVLERQPEIGLRRALGARPRHIAGQVLAETSLVGTLGGIIGAALGILAVLLVSLARQWTPLLESWVYLPAPLLGGLIGVAAGLYPALRAATIEPVHALQR